MLPISFLLITLLSLLLFYFATGRAIKSLLVFAGWAMVAGAVAATGRFQQHPLLFPPVIIITVILTVLLFRSIHIERINSRLLLAVHVVRIPVELVLYQLYLQHKIPQLMTFNGWNFDILVGLSALLLLGYQLITKKSIGSKFLVAWNVAGLLFLTTIVVLAILSSPLPLQQFGFEQPNVAVLAFPYILLPAVVVPVVYLSHFLALKAIKKS